MITYLTQCKKLSHYIDIYNYISNDLSITYKKYKYILIFYQVSQFYFNNVDEKTYIKTWKFFVDLYEYIDQILILGDEKNLELSQKQYQILMGICLRIILEYPLSEDFFRMDQKKIKKISADIDQSLNKTTINQSSSSKNLYIIGDNSNINLEDEKESSKIRTNSPSLDISSTMKEKLNNKTELKRSSFNLNTIISNKDKTEKYSKYYSFSGLFTKFCTSFNINDYTFKSMFLFILEKNNEASIIQSLKFHFIIRISSFSDLCSSQIRKYLNLSYFNRETREQLSSLASLLDLPRVHLGHICYELFIFIAVNEATQYATSRCVFRHLLASKNVLGKAFVATFRHSPEASEVILREFPNFLSLVMPHHKNPFLLDFLLFSSLDKGLRHYGQVLVNTLLVLNFGCKRGANSFYYTFKAQCLRLLYRIVKSEAFTGEERENEQEKLAGKVEELNEEIKKEEDIPLSNKINNDNKIRKRKSEAELKESIKALNNIDSFIYSFSDQGINELFDEDLVCSKFNMFKNTKGKNQKKNKKKCYIEMLFDVLTGLIVVTKQNKYILLMYTIFVMNIQKFKFTNNNAQSILYYAEKGFQTNQKHSPLKEYFPNSEMVDFPSITLRILYKTLKLLIKFQKFPEIASLFLSLVSSFFEDSKLVYQEYRTAKAEISGKIIYNYMLGLIKSATKNNKMNNTDFVASFKVKYNQNIYEKKKKDKHFEDNKKEKDNKLDDNTLYNDNSFESCCSTKSIKNICEKNNKKSFKNISTLTAFRKKEKTFLGLFRDKETALINDVLSSREDTETDIINSSPRELNKSTISNIINSSEKDNNYNTNYSTNSSNFSGKSTLNLNPFSLDLINGNTNVILFPKAQLLEQKFGVYFSEMLFHNEPFIKMKRYFKYKIGKYDSEGYPQDIDINNFFNFPIIMRNYIPNNFYFGGLFVKQDLDFFANRYFHISHKYFINKARECKNRRIFKRVSEMENIQRYIMDLNDNQNRLFYVDLISSKYVIFGELIITKTLIYFNSIDKKNFLDSKKEEEKYEWLLCPPTYDYSNKKKRLFIFKRDIVEILNRRFLYQFQACEVYLKNGKSYYFNLYSEKKKIELFTFLQNEGFYKYNIVTDLKSEFKSSGLTKRWLSNKLSTLSYLLMINKYSCRSYNDVNQYPVFPWLKIYGNRLRDLHYPIAAQTNDARDILVEKFNYSSDTFPFHYTTHYSNAAYNIYYLIRLNPFTDNQITLQINKFDAPARQFNSIDELQSVLYLTKQPRELIPEFFMTTEFFYNFNCNYFGVKNKDRKLVHNLRNKEGFKSPLEYILKNAELLEHPYFKEQIDGFLDNIFGKNQIAGKELCNTYSEECYQELNDLRQLINTLRDDGYSFTEIEVEVASKSNKIISFGQTPFKLLEDKHPRWQKKSLTEAGDIPSNSQINNINKKNQIKEKIIYVVPCNSNINNNVKNREIYVLVRKSNVNFEIKFYDYKLNEEITRNLQIPKKIKLFSKYHIFENRFLWAYKYNPKFIIIDFNLTLFVICHFVDNFFILLNSKNKVKYYMTESVVTCVIKTSDTSFMTGHLNGKIIEWNIKGLSQNEQNNQLIDNYELSVKRSLLAHEQRIKCLYFSSELSLLISAGEDKKIFIRKYFDFTLLSVIKLQDEACVDLIISQCFLYSLLFDEKQQKHIIKIFSVNGLCVGNSEYGHINDIAFAKNGMVLVGYFKENKIKIHNSSMTKILKEINLNDDDNKNKEIKSNNYFMGFNYKKESSVAYCHFSSGILKRKYIELPDINIEN